MSWTTPAYIFGYTASYTSALRGYTASYTAAIFGATAHWVAYENGIPVINTPVNIALPVITGTVKIGQTLSCSTGDWTSPTPISYSYLWLRDGIPIGGATTNTYLLVNADYDADITCQVSATNNDGTSFAVTDPVGPVVDAAPVNTVAPVVSGSAIVGGTLSCTTGTWTFNQTPTYTYQWKRDGSDITGATSSTYQLVSADNGEPMSCAVTATNDGGSNSANGNTLTPPSTFSITSVTPGDTTVTVTWSAVTGATSYNVKYGTSPGNYTTTVTGVSSPYQVTGLTDGTTYYFMVVAVNSAGSTNANAELSTAPVWTNVKSLDFGSSNSNKWLNAGQNHNFSWSSAFSMSFYVKFRTTAGALIVAKQTSGSTGWDFRVASAKFQWYSSPNGATNRIQWITTNSFSTGTWYHVVVTYSGNSSATGFKIYVNGSSQAITVQFNTSASNWTTAQDFNFGTYNNGSGAYYNGQLDEVTFWNKELSSGEVTSLYNAGVPLNPGVISFWSNNTSYWRFGDVNDSASTIYDRGNVGGVNLSGNNLVSGDFTTDIP